MSTNKKSINKDWIKITNEKFDSLRIELAFCSNSQLTTLSSSLLFVMCFTISSLLVISLKKKKNRKTIFVVFFFSIVLSSIEKKKNQKTISVDFFLDWVSSSISLSSSSINFEFRLVTQSFRSFFSSILREIAVLFDALMKNVVSFSKICLSAKYLTKLHHDVLFSILFTFKIVIWRILFPKKSSKSDYVNIKKTHQILKRIVRLRYVVKMTRDLNAS